MFELAVIILNYQTPKLVEACLDSLASQLSARHHRAIVVDSASPDDSANQIKSDIQRNGWEHWAKLQVLTENRGFSAGNNAGILSTPAKFYWLTNSDTLFRTGAVESLLKAAKEHANAGIISPRLEWKDSTPQISCFRYPTPVSELIEGAQTGPLTKLFRKYDVPIPVTNEPIFPEWTSFASVLIRNEVVEQVGLLDDDYFMYFEDIDYCRRARKAGWEILHWPDAQVVHLRGGSSSVKKDTASRRRRPMYYYRARSNYFRKFFGASGQVRANLMWEVGNGIAKIREFLGNKEPHACEREWLDIWRG